MSKLHELAALGQAIWLDYIQRRFITSGEMQALIDQGVRGMTSNPTIFEKAILGSQDSGQDQMGEYDSELESLSRAGFTPLQVYEALAIKDIQIAADLLRPVFDETDGEDGFVSLEVNPKLARQTGQTIEEAQRLWSQVDRPNLMIKIPATKEGLPAITATLASGINVNVTLIFSIKRYHQVVDAYLEGLEGHLATGKPLNQIASVASFFVSRIDSKVDAQLESIQRDVNPQADLAATLKGKAAVANARLAYSLFQELFGGQRFAALNARGARLQRPLWASTSTKNPAYSDILYVQELIGAHTVNTVPQNTLDAFLEHGEVRLTINEGIEEARWLMDKLENLGISMKQVTQELEDEGVEAFAKSFTSLLQSVENRQSLLMP